MAVQRLRVRYGRTGELQYIAHLDMMRLWERAFRRAGIPVSYSEGSMPRPRLSIAAALPVGVTSDAELLDVYLNRRVSPFYFMKRLESAIPQNLKIHEAFDVPLDAPSLQSQVREAEYRVVVETEAPAEAIDQAVQALLDRQTIPWEHHRDKEVRRYNLRELVRDVWLEGKANGQATLGMMLRTDPSASGRPEQVVAALGIPAQLVTVHRTKLVLAGPRRDRR